ACGGSVLNFSSLESSVGNSGTDLFNIKTSLSANLDGQGGDDTFAFFNNAVLTGTLTGGSQSAADTLTYADASNTTAVTINLANLNGIETVIGSSGSDTLVAVSGGTTFSINGEVGANSGTAG